MILSIYKINEVNSVSKDLKNRRLRIFDFTRDGKGISKSASELGWGFKRFFVTFKENFNKILYCNIFFVLGNFPILFFIATIPGYTKLESYIPFYDFLQNISHLFTSGDKTPFDMALYALEGLQSKTYVDTTVTYIFYGISSLSLLTFGLVNVGTCYILRNIAKGEPVFVWSDFWYAIKRNIKQALPFGIIDIAIIGVLINNIQKMFLGTGDNNLFTSTMLWSNVVIFILYFFMRYYIYIQMVTFNLSIFKILKNSLIFALLGIKRNIVALGGILAVLFLEFICLFWLGGVLIPLAVGLPLLILISAMAYMKVYAAYYKIKVVMIDPYLETSPEENIEEESVMRDDVTDLERLEEIKEKNNIE